MNSFRIDILLKSSNSLFFLKQPPPKVRFVCQGLGLRQSISSVHENTAHTASSQNILLRPSNSLFFLKQPPPKAGSVCQGPELRQPISSVHENTVHTASSQPICSQLDGRLVVSHDTKQVVSFTKTAENRLDDLEGILGRIRKLTTQSDSDNPNSRDRLSIHLKCQQLKQKINPRTNLANDNQIKLPEENPNAYHGNRTSLTIEGKLDRVNTSTMGNVNQIPNLRDLVISLTVTSFHPAIDSNLAIYNHQIRRKQKSDGKKFRWSRLTSSKPTDRRPKVIDNNHMIFGIEVVTTNRLLITVAEMEFLGQRKIFFKNRILPSMSSTINVAQTTIGDRISYQPALVE